MKKSFLTGLLLAVTITVFAGEGMWLPIFLKQLNEQDMVSKGMKISAEDVYSVNKSSLKDAVVLFGGGCTGEIISDQGLLLTNHHCGFGQIQSLSTLENNYLKDGFWAYTSEQELACPGLSVTFIIRMEDVTNAVNDILTPSMSESERDEKIKEVSGKLEKEATAGTHYTASVKPFYYGNQHYLFVMETFKDVRMVGAPPSSIGKFGGDTDNWMWPRHTGDFSLFRVYADKDNKPAEYSKDNIPFKPRHYLPVSLKGVHPGDFTMVFGFPGRTTEYIPSYAVKTIVEVNNPARIKIRDARLEIIDAAMRSSEKLRLMYASKQASIANAWKKWQGELRGLKRLNTITVKQQEEKQFTEWVKHNNKTQYSNLLSDYEKAYNEYKPLTKTVDYINEAVYGVEMVRYARGFDKLIELANAKPVDDKALKEETDKQIKGAEGFFKNLDPETDKKLFASMMRIYSENMEDSLEPGPLKDLLSKYNNKHDLGAGEIYKRSVLGEHKRLTEFLQDFNSKKVGKLKDDVIYKLAKSFFDLYHQKIETRYRELNAKIALLNREYMAAQMEMHPDKKFYPDANSTLRVAYGNVEPYEPRDAVKYLHYTTLEGIIEKEDSTVEEFEVPTKLKELFYKKDYGNYGVNGELPVAFVASNHTTGGNSGSPVINANGELIGTNFDRVWEGTMSDIDFDPSQCRNISLDIRYTLFIIDKYASCQRLIDEMKIIR